MSALWWLLWGCASGPQPAEVHRLVQAGELDAAAAALTAQPVDPEDPLAPLVPLARKWQTLGPQQAALRSAGREMLRDAIELRLQAGDLQGTAGPLASAIAVWPDDLAFLQLAHNLGERAHTAEPAEAVAVWLALAEILAHDPPRSASYRTQAAQAALGQRYTAEGWPSTAAAIDGITVAAGGEILDVIDREYVDAPDWTECRRGGTRRLSWLARDGGAQQRWPGLPDAPLPVPSDRTATVAAARADLAAAASTLDTVGVPKGVVVREWMSGCLDTLDPWTRAVWPAEIAAWQSGHAGVRVGVGLELDVGSDGAVVVARPLPDSPAWTSGIHQGDGLIAIDDGTGERPVRGLSEDPAGRLAAARTLLQGPVDSTVHLTLGRNGAAPRTVSLVRAPVADQTVAGFERGADNTWSVWADRPDGIAYVRIDAFKPTTPDQLDALLEPALGQISTVVLDLRGNAGGDVNAAVQIADRFIADGWLARIDGRVLPDTGPDVDTATGAPLAEWNQAVPGHALEGTPVIVLVDGQTASAAEVLAGALQERLRAPVLGDPTWGKGFAQALRTAPDGTWALQFTNLAWALPSGTRLARDGTAGGIAPGLALPASTPAEQYQLDRLWAVRHALRVHADGTPMVPLSGAARADLPALDDDPAVVAAVWLAKSR